MRMPMVGVLVAMIALVPAIAAAQTSGTGSSGAGSSGSGTSSKTPSTAPGAGTSSGSSTSTPSASPSGSSAKDLSQYMTQADCERGGGMWEAASKKCSAKK